MFNTLHQLYLNKNHNGIKNIQSQSKEGNSFFFFIIVLSLLHIYFKILYAFAELSPTPKRMSLCSTKTIKFRYNTSRLFTLVLIYSYHIL